MADDEARFAFGENWRNFLGSIDEPRIEEAIRSLTQTLDLDSLEGCRFLDMGCGSGLFSLAAHRLGGDVVSVDYDVASVACTEEMRSRFAESHDRWTIMQGSVLDDALMSRLGTFDVVYSWGVLHHTGDMNAAIGSASERVAMDGGLFCIAIYNDQGGASKRWLSIKKFYNRLPAILRPVWVASIAGCYETKFALARLSRLKNPMPFADWSAKKRDRGMSAWHDWVDWVGGLPFEVARPEAIIVPLRRRGFVLENMRTVGSGWGCNEYVFRRTDIG